MLTPISEPRGGESLAGSLLLRRVGAPTASTNCARGNLHVLDQLHVIIRVAAVLPLSDFEYEAAVLEPPDRLYNSFLSSISGSGALRLLAIDEAHESPLLKPGEPWRRKPPTEVTGPREL